MHSWAAGNSGPDFHLLCFELIISDAEGVKNHSPSFPISSFWIPLFSHNSFTRNCSFRLFWSVTLLCICAFHMRKGQCLKYILSGGERDEDKKGIMRVQAAVPWLGQELSWHALSSSRASAGYQSLWALGSPGPRASLQLDQSACHRARFQCHWPAVTQPSGWPERDTRDTNLCSHPCFLLSEFST